MQIRELGVRCPVTISPFQSTDDAIELMWQHDTRYLLVTDRQGLVGLVSDADLLESVGMLLRCERLVIGQSISTENLIVADVMDTRCPCVTPKDLVTDAAHRLVHENRSALPVVDQDQLLGVITDYDLLQLFAGSCWLKTGTPHQEAVAHYGSHVPRTVRPQDPLATACARLSGGKIRHLMVAEAAQFVGMLSDWDIRLAIGENAGGEWLNLPVCDYMAIDVQTLRPRDTLICAAEVVRMEKLTAVPITSREGELLGMITVGDLLRALAWPEPVNV
jgi:CBS domain-containing protein